MPSIPLSPCPFPTSTAAAASLWCVCAPLLIVYEGGLRLREDSRVVVHVGVGGVGAVGNVGGVWSAALFDCFIFCFMSTAIRTKKGGELSV